MTIIIHETDYLFFAPTTSLPQNGKVDELHQKRDCTIYHQSVRYRTDNVLRCFAASWLSPISEVAEARMDFEFVECGSEFDHCRINDGAMPLDLPQKPDAARGRCVCPNCWQSPRRVGNTLGTLGSSDTQTSRPSTFGHPSSNIDIDTHTTDVHFNSPF
jgi:hypothetical protein